MSRTAHVSAGWCLCEEAWSGGHLDVDMPVMALSQAVQFAEIESHTHTYRHTANAA